MFLEATAVDLVELQGGGEVVAEGLLDDDAADGGLACGVELVIEPDAHQVLRHDAVEGGRRGEIVDIVPRIVDLGIQLLEACLEGRVVLSLSRVYGQIMDAGEELLG